MAQSIKRPTLGFDSGYDLRVVIWALHWVWSLLKILFFSLCPPRASHPKSKMTKCLSFFKGNHDIYMDLYGYLCTLFCCWWDISIKRVICLKAKYVLSGGFIIIMLLDILLLKLVFKSLRTTQFYCTMVLA